MNARVGFSAIYFNDRYTFYRQTLIVWQLQRILPEGLNAGIDTGWGSVKLKQQG